jgi:phosphate transport system substrate-binding protein
MNRRHFAIAFGACAVAAPAAAVDLPEWIFSRRTLRRPLLIAGSSSMAALNAALAKDFSKLYPDIDTVIEAGSSLSALIALKRGSIDVAALDRDVSDDEDEKGLRNYLIARDGIYIVANRQSTIGALTSAQVREIFEGNVDDWAQLGGPNAAIELMTLARGVPGRRFMEDKILRGAEIPPSSTVHPTSAQLIEAVAGNPRAIGFALLDDLQSSQTVRQLPIDGVEVSRATILSNRYPFTRSLCLSVWNDDAGSTAHLFIDFARSARGREIIEAQAMIATV